MIYCRLPEYNYYRALGACYHHQTFPYHQRRRYYHTKVQHLVIKLKMTINFTALFVFLPSDDTKGSRSQDVNVDKWVFCNAKYFMLYIAITSGRSHVNIAVTISLGTSNARSIILRMNTFTRIIAHMKLFFKNPKTLVSNLFSINTESIPLSTTSGLIQPNLAQRNATILAFLPFGSCTRQL